MTKEQILQTVDYDIDKAKEIYEWLNAGETSQEPIITNHNAIIEVYHSEKYEGVRVQALGEDFVIGLHDLDNGKNDFDYDNAMSRLKELNMTTFNRKQAAIVCIYIDQINDKLIEAGGDEFADDGYLTQELYIPRSKRSCAGYNASGTWCFYGADGCFCGNGRYYGLFRCRPVLSFPLPN